MSGQPSSLQLAASVAIVPMAAPPVVAFPMASPPVVASPLADALAVETSFCPFASCELMLLANR